MSPDFRARPLVAPPFFVAPVLLALAAMACQTLETEAPTPVGTDAGASTGGSSAVGGAGGDGQTGGAGPSGGTGGSGTGGSGTGGSTGGSGTGGGGGGELPPPPPGCEPLTVTANAVEHTAISRAGAVEIRYTAPEGARIEGLSPEGGLFTLQRSGKLYYSPGGSIDSDAELRAPWTTGPVHVTVRATDANGCRGEATTTVQVDGDVIVSDAPSGSLYIMGSDGRVIGQWRGGWPRGADALLRLPAEAGGGFVLGIPGYADEAPRVERIESADPGADVEFEMQNRSGEALYPDDEGPRSLIYDPNGDDGRGEIIGDNAPNGVVHRWTLDGSYNGVYAFGAAGGGNGPVSMGFARLSDGRIVYGLRDQRDVYVIGGGTVESFLRYEVGAECLGQGHGGTVVICGSDSPYMIWTRFGAQANQIDRFAGPQIYAPRMVGPFREGYLRTDPSGFSMTYHAANLTEPEDTSDLWAQDYQERNGLEYPRAFVWLGP
jgi:hypothetical protein